jgi:ligand-binding SRPBCC domain-containing protein
LSRSISRQTGQELENPGMKRQVFLARTSLKAAPEAVFRWHARPEALEELTPPWESVVVEARTGGIEETGSRVQLRMRVGPWRPRWIAAHKDCIPGRRFRDVQVKGPFAVWEHTHEFLPDGDGSILEDRVEYALPGGRLAHWLFGGFVRRKLKRLFDYRHRVTAAALGGARTP